MTLLTAQRYAAKIVEWLAPFCEHIEIVGSIRRERPECGDVDLVCIPKVRAVKDLVGLVIEEESALRWELIRYVRASEERSAAFTPLQLSTGGEGGSRSGVNAALRKNVVEWNTAGEPKPDAKNLLLQFSQVPARYLVRDAGDTGHAARVPHRQHAAQHLDMLASSQNGWPLAAV